MTVSYNSNKVKSPDGSSWENSDRFADTGCSYRQSSPVREMCFQAGFLTATLACWEDALRIHSVKIFQGRIAANTEQAEAFRSTTNCRTDRAAWKRGKRVRHSYVESDQNQRRWVRGRHHGLYSIKHGLGLFLKRHPNATMPLIRESLSVYVDAICRWASTTPYDATYGRCEPPFWQHCMDGVQEVTQ